MPTASFPLSSSWARDGLVAVGGPLTPERLIEAYRRGIFPWPADESPAGLLWCSPDPRAILLPAGLHVPRRLARTIAQKKFSITADVCFSRVVEACASVADRRKATWITPQLRREYLELHRRGIAHSVEAWSGGQLAGGIYGVCLGGMFAGESMFSVERDASKVALVQLVAALRDSGCTLFDVQVASEHLTQFGVLEVGREDFLLMLARALELPNCWPATFS
jgi:leucyl/phenylalanyl-tRNA--protein transferase